MDLLSVGGYNLRSLDRQNIILGKNGCGKSRLLKQIEQALPGRPEVGAFRYISPERAGVLQYEPGIEHNITSSPSWLADTRRQNQAQQFRQQSTAQFRRLELLVLREIERNPKVRNDLTQNFDRVIARINGLLDRVYLERGDPSFVIKDKKSGDNVGAGEISSGESELISLGIEALVFARECVKDRLNILLLDEPDVHLHPDLQARFGRFLSELFDDASITLLIATHSTAFLGAMEASNLRIAFLRYGDTNLSFAAVDDIHRRILPVFGAHPLSNIFNEAPVLLLEGDDDERVWQQAVRSANGRITLYPVAVDSVDKLAPFEQEVAVILEAVYDNAVGYSLRDRDESPSEITDIGPVRRFRLNCRAAENLLLTDDVLVSVGLDWPELEKRINEWLAVNQKHPHYEAMKTFADAGYDRRNANLKEIRNDLMGLMGTNKPWEVKAGQAIARVVLGQAGSGAFGMRDFLGGKVCETMLRVTA